MSVNAFLDSNLLLYVLSADERKSGIATELVRAGGTVSVQTLNEFTSVARRKLGLQWPEVTDMLRIFRSRCRGPMPLTVVTHERALKLAERYGYNIYDSMIIASALEAGCKILYSEDMRDGQVIEGLAIENPFARKLT